MPERQSNRVRRTSPLLNVPARERHGFEGFLVNGEVNRRMWGIVGRSAAFARAGPSYSKK